MSPLETPRPLDALPSVRVRSVALKVKLVPLKKRAYMRESWKRLVLLHHASRPRYVNVDHLDAHVDVNLHCSLSSQPESRSCSNSGSRSAQSLSVPPRPRTRTQWQDQFCPHSHSISTPSTAQQRPSANLSQQGEGSVHSVSRSYPTKHTTASSSTPPSRRMLTRGRAKAVSASISPIHHVIPKYHTIHS